jgi:hypothetical protein
MGPKQTVCSGRSLRAEKAAENNVHGAIALMQQRRTRETRDWREQVISARRLGARRPKRMQNE